MKKVLILLLIIFLFSSYMFAQQKKYEYKKAIAASLLFPGGGELYIKKYKTAGVLITSEVITLLSYIRMKNQVTWEEENYEQYAYVKAGIPKGSKNYKYELAAKWFSSEDYNNEVKLTAQNYYYDDPERYQMFLDRNLIPEDKGWNWHSISYWKKFRKYKENTQNYKIYANLIASGFVLNRLFSLVDSMISIKKKNKFRLSATCNLKKKGIGIRYVYHF